MIDSCDWESKFKNKVTDGRQSANKQFDDEIRIDDASKAVIGKKPGFELYKPLNLTSVQLDNAIMNRLLYLSGTTKVINNLNEFDPDSGVYLADETFKTTASFKESASLEPDGGQSANKECDDEELFNYNSLKVIGEHVPWIERFGAQYREKYLDAYLPSTRALVKWKPRIEWFQWLDDQEDSADDDVEEIF